MPEIKLGGWTGLNLNPYAVWTAGSDGQLDYLSERWNEWTGRSGFGMAWKDSVHPDDLLQIEGTWHSAVQSGEPVDVEHRLCMLGGSYRWMRTRALPERDSLGAVTRWYGATEDIDDHKRAHQALKNSEAALKALTLSLNQQIKSRTDELTALNRHLQCAREEERNRLAGALHDDLGALFTAAKFDVARLKSALAPLSPEVAARIGHFSDMLDKSIDSKRHMIEDLRPSALNSLGLVQALTILINDFTCAHGIKVQVELEELPLKPAVQLTIYRLAQEALANVAAYAQADNVHVRLSRAGDQQGQISVTDDGVGFDASSERIAMLGLLSMHYRVEAEGGCFAVESSHQCGTTLSACFPVDELSATLALN
ncbi:MAG: PAS domain-containing protein [Polaromonas sp.]|nr:PAS domain-containing protein [Polaromonas sp.]